MPKNEKQIKKSALRSHIFISEPGIAPLELRTIAETIILGFILCITGFVVLGYSEGINIETEKIKQIKLTEVHELKKKVGIVKVTGEPIATCKINQENCADNFIYKKKYQGGIFR